MKLFTISAIVFVLISFVKTGHGQLANNKENYTFDFNLVDKTFLSKSTFTLPPSTNDLGILLKNNNTSNKSYFDPSYNKYLKSGTQQNRFNINFSPADQHHYFNGCIQSTSLVINGYDPYHTRPIQQPTFTENLFYSVLVGLVKNSY